MSQLKSEVLPQSATARTAETAELSAAEYVKVGKVKDAHGIRGELFVVVFAGEAAWLSKLKELRFLPNDDAPESSVRKFSVKSVRAHKNGFIAKTGEIKDRNEAETLKGWTFEIPKEFFVSNTGESIYLREIEGFKIFTKEQGEVGSIDGFGSNGVQDLLLVKAAGGVVFEIPFVEAFVETIDYNERRIVLNLPEGLLGEGAETASNIDDGNEGSDDGSDDGAVGDESNLDH